MAYTTETLGDVNAHTFNELTLGTAHVLEVAASVTAGDSAFASLTLLVPPTVATPTTTSSSISVSWGEVTGATGYELKRLASGSDCDASGTDATTSLLTHTFSQGLSSSTSYVICVRATNAQGESAWASTTARTSAPAPPPKVPDPPSVNCLSSRVVETNVVWRTCCQSTRAATLLNLLITAGDSVVGIWKWDGENWELYARVDGRLVPGSTNFLISGGTLLRLIAPASAGSDGAWTPPPPPTAEELKRLALLAEQ